MRRPVAIGFYPSDAKELEKTVNSLLVAKTKIPALGAIVPHSGYIFGGKIAGRTFASIQTNARDFVILCPNHSGRGANVALSSDEWSTPLGTIKVNKKLVASLEQSKLFKIDETSHSAEHSAEVLLPFLQILWPDCAIVPICLQELDFEKLEDLAKILIEICGKSFFIASSDFIHFGPMYGYAPISGSLKRQVEWTQAKERELIALICEMKAKEFYESVLYNGYTVCGFIPITLLILIMKKLGSHRAHLMGHSTSADVRPDDNFVGYVGILFE